jgi:phosphatidylserine decarboxylase
MMSNDKTPEIPAELVPTTVSSAPAADAVTPMAPATGAARPIAPHAAGTAPAAWQWPSIHPESYRFAGMSGAIALVSFLAGWSFIGWVLVALTVFICAFFRDPKRASPAGEGLILSPADGLVSQIVTVELPRQLLGDGALSAGTATRISIFMSVFDVHINRAPIGGTVTRMAYVPGAFLNADLDKASEENERQYFLIEGADGTKVGFTQIAGLIARRIIGFVREGSMVGMGQRVGLIRFGSRVDVFLPEGFAPQVVKGQRAVAGETILAAKGAAPAVAGAIQ